MAKAINWAERGKRNEHPLRLRILKALQDGPQSPNRLSKALKEPLGNVSYHMKVLDEWGDIVLTKTEPRRGALEHFYKLA